MIKIICYKAMDAANIIFFNGLLLNNMKNLISSLISNLMTNTNEASIVKVLYEIYINLLKIIII